MFIKNTNLTIMVSNMDHSIAFYTSLGFTLAKRWGDHYVQITAPDITIGLHPNANNPHFGNSGNVSIGLRTDNFQEAELQLKTLNIKYHKREEEGGLFLHFNDPDGTALYVIQPKW